MALLAFRSSKKPKGWFQPSIKTDDWGSAHREKDMTD